MGDLTPSPITDAEPFSEEELESFQFRAHYRRRCGQQVELEPDELDRLLSALREARAERDRLAARANENDVARDTLL